MLSAGRLYCDLVFRGLPAMPRLGEERFAEDVAIVPGGGGFITAAHLAGLGRPAALLSRLGEIRFRCRSCRRSRPAGSTSPS